MNLEISLLHLLLNDSDEAADKRDLAIDILSGVPEVLMEIYLAFIVKTHLANSYRMNGLSSSKLWSREDHGPANVVIWAGA